MKPTLHFQSKLNFSSELLQKVQHCIDENQCHTIWYGPVWETAQFHVLWIYVQNKTKTATVFSPAYVEVLFHEHNVLLLLLDKEDIAYHDVIGNTLFKTSLTQDRIIYHHHDRPNLRLLYKPIESFRTLYRDQQALLSKFCQDFVESKITGSNHAYLKCMEYNFEILERILLGVINTKATFTERLLLLERIVPQMKTLFVKRKNKVYILEDLMFDTLSSDDSMWIAALQKVQDKLQQIVEDTLTQIDQKTALIPTKEPSKKKNISSFKYKEKLLPLLETNQVEEIYQFHETLYFQEKKQIQHCYLLVLTKKKPFKKLHQIIQDISSKDEQIHFTIVAHTRSYIQDHVDLFPDFFKAILKTKNRIYYNDYYPQIHWYTNYALDDTYYCYSLKKNIEKTNKIIQSNLTDSITALFLSTYQLHKCLVLKLQVYILHHLQYLPKTTDLNTLVYLALYAQNKEATSLNYLYKQLEPHLFMYTAKKREEKKNNLVLDTSTAHVLQQFFSAIEVSIN